MPEIDQPRRRGERQKRGAWAEALRLLAVRPLTEAELRGRLRERRHEDDEIESVVERLVDSGQLGDAALARHYIVTRSDRLGHGPRKLVGELVRRGVGQAVAESAWRAAVESGDVDPPELLRRELRRRVAGRRLAPREQRRVYNALLRAGFEPADVYAELVAHRGFPDLTEDERLDGTDDDFA